MKARYSTTTTPVAGWFRYSRIRVVVLLSMVMIGIVLASTLYRALTLASVTAPATASLSAALDQHERHPNLFAPVAANVALDQHERHPNLFAPVAQQAAALDQHERHPDLFAPVAENVAPPDALDRWLAAANR